MIHFACPRCRVTLKVHDQKMGSKGHCPSCRQRVQVPMPPRTKTLLAAPVEAPAVAASLPSNSPYPQAIPLEPPLGVAPQPVRRTRAWRLLVILGCVVGLLLLAATSGAIYLATMLTGPKPWAVLPPQVVTPSGNPGGQPPGTVKPDNTVAEQGDFRLTVLLIEVVPDRAAGMAVIYFLAENKSETRKVDLSPLTGIAKVTDELGNKYRPMMTLPLGNAGPLNPLGFGTLRPGDFAICLLPCEPPVDKAKFLYVKFPGVGKDESIKFAIPLKEDTATYKHLMASPSQKEEPYTILFQRAGFQDWFAKLEQRLNRLSPFP
jgi:hypothetical protein